MRAHQVFDCKGCEVAQGYGTVGVVVTLPGGWTLNHYSGREGYLGWLALQPCEHVTTFADLNEGELRALGPNIHKIENVLSGYWRRVFRDRIERLYIVYFYEGCGPYHLHMHLIPRFASLDDETLQAWNAPRATRCARFPAQYQRGGPDFEKHVCDLMNDLKKHLEGIPDASVV